MSQVNLHEIIQQQQKQLVVMQAQIQALLAGGAERVGREEGRGGGTEVAKPQIFDGTLAKVEGFISACKLYIRMRLRGGFSRRASAVDFVICARGNSRCMEREYNGGIRECRSRV